MNNLIKNIGIVNGESKVVETKTDTSNKKEGMSMFDNLLSNAKNIESNKELPEQKIENNLKNEINIKEEKPISLKDFLISIKEENKSDKSLVNTIDKILNQNFNNIENIDSNKLLKDITFKLEININNINIDKLIPNNTKDITLLKLKNLIIEKDFSKSLNEVINTPKIEDIVVPNTKINTLDFNLSIKTKIHTKNDNIPTKTEIEESLISIKNNNLINDKEDKIIKVKSSILEQDNDFSGEKLIIKETSDNINTKEKILNNKEELIIKETPKINIDNMLTPNDDIKKNEINLLTDNIEEDKNKLPEEVKITEKEVLITTKDNITNLPNIEKEKVSIKESLLVNINDNNEVTIKSEVNNKSSILNSDEILNSKLILPLEENLSKVNTKIDNNIEIDNKTKMLYKSLFSNVNKEIDFNIQKERNSFIKEVIGNKDIVTIKNIKELASILKIDVGNIEVIKTETTKENSFIKNQVITPIIIENNKNINNKVESSNISVRTSKEIIKEDESKINVESRLDNKEVIKTNNNLIDNKVEVKKEIINKIDLTNTEEKINNNLIDNKYNQINLLAEIKGKIFLAKQNITSFMSNLSKEMYRNYKHPLTSLRISLNPENLGKIDITMRNIKSTTNMNIDMNFSNEKIMETFIKNQTVLISSILQNFTSSKEIKINFGLSKDNKEDRKESEKRTISSLKSSKDENEIMDKIMDTKYY